MPASTSTPRRPVWRIYGSGGMPAGTQFNVLVNPAQVFDCTDLSFADGFQ